MTTRLKRGLKRDNRAKEYKTKMQEKLIKQKTKNEADIGYVLVAQESQEINVPELVLSLHQVSLQEFMETGRFGEDIKGLFDKLSFMELFKIREKFIQINTDVGSDGLDLLILKSAHIMDLIISKIDDASLLRDYKDFPNDLYRACVEEIKNRKLIVD